MKQESKLNRQCLRPIQNQGGQSVIEFVLLLVVVVSFIMLARPFFPAAVKHMNKVMGTYVACLMEFGELPSLGVQNAELKKHKGGAAKTCDNAWEGADIGSVGSSATGGGGGGPGGGRGSGVNRGNTSQNASGRGNNNGGNREGQNQSSRGRGSGFGGGSNSGGGGMSEKPGRQSADSASGFGKADAPMASNSKTTIIQEEEGSGSARRGDSSSNRNQSRVAYRRNAYRGISGRMNEELEKTLKKAPKVPVARSIAKVEEGYQMKVYKKKFTPPVKKDDIVREDKNEGFSFGSLIRWLIIGGMILALVVLFGGQLLNYSNSDS